MLNKKISVIIPAYNEEQSLPILLDEIEGALSGKFEYEIIVIDDGSTDGSFELLQKRAKSDGKIRVSRFLRNYGKSTALSEGFKKARGDYVITLDSDLQDDPNEIPRLIEILESGYDLVSGWKKNRRDPFSKRVPSKFFNFITRILTGIKLHDFNCGLKAYRKSVVKSLDIYGGMHRYIPVLVCKKGYKVTETVVNHRQRKYGTTKFGRERYFHGLFDLMTVLFLNRYTRRPLHLFGIFGLISLISGLGIDVWVLFLKYGFGEPFQKHMALLVFGVLLLILGVQFISIGLLGEMIAKANIRSTEIIYVETADRESPSS
ncbi:MAG: glycosyltransferase family 2 protein [Candidatus Marinimicrobia bacterium]|nr:glycosyltransferase family 2 protein [Candidatus Neomarinimicrobiota bacterium]